MIYLLQCYSICAASIRNVYTCLFVYVNNIMVAMHICAFLMDISLYLIIISFTQCEKTGLM